MRGTIPDNFTQDSEPAPVCGPSAGSAIASWPTDTTGILKQITADSHEAVLIADVDGRLIEVSRKAPEIFGVPSAASATARHLHDLLPETLEQAAHAVLDAFRTGMQAIGRSGECRIEVAGEERILDYTITPSRLAGPDGAVFVCITARDVTVKRRQAHRLEYLSQHDELTGALRRHALLDAIDHQIENGRGCAVLVLNLHRFKTINLTLGRPVGDMVLKAVAERLATFDPEFAGPARLGADTFALYAPARLSRDDLDTAAATLTRIINAPFRLSGVSARVGVHIGISSHRSCEATCAERLLDEAEMALDEARKTAGTGIAHFDPAQSARQSRARAIERELWKALDRSEFSLAYQPQVRLSDGCIIGAEALVRWTHSDLGRIAPSDFVEVAEATGFVEDLGRWVLNEACRDAMSWTTDIAVAVNVSPVQFARGHIVADVRAALDRSGLPAQRLTLEITESAFLQPSNALMESLAALRALGVSLALDDFGTGYASFGYLKRFPLNKIKVDQMFVRTLTTDQASQAVIQSIKVLTDGLGLSLICEGIETEEQRLFLRLIGCQEGQGYLFGKPQRTAELAAYLREQARLRVSAGLYSVRA